MNLLTGTASTALIGGEEQLARLDLGDQIGASVVRTLLAGSDPGSLGLKRA